MEDNSRKIGILVVKNLSVKNLTFRSIQEWNDEDVLFAVIIPVVK